MDNISEIQRRVHQHRDDIIRFMRDICAIPSMNSQIGPVGERIQAELRVLGWDETRFDKMGNTIGRIGDGPMVIVYDSHIDTVGVGDPGEWEWDPFVGKVEDGRLYARGACDEKGSTPGMVEHFYQEFPPPDVPVSNWDDAATGTPTQPVESGLLP